MYLSFLSCRITSPSPYSKLDSFDQKQELEKEFCRDFSCCGLSLGNLHQLLEHYEEYHLSRGGSGSEDDERDHHHQIENNKTINFMMEEDISLLQQPMHLALLAATTTKEHLTNSDLTMLENAQKYASRSAAVQTLDSIVDGLNTPSLSPSESGLSDDFDDDTALDSSWVHRANIIMSSSTSHNSNNEGKTLIFFSY
jgi:hypothetical protein